MSLSDKLTTINSAGYKMLSEGDVKDFIKALKNLKDKYGSVAINYVDLFNEIDRLAGDKLI